MLKTKALYNLLRLHPDEGDSVQIESWAKEDYRSLDLATLFERLKAYQVILDKDSFIQFADQCDTPEDLADLLLSDDAKDEVKDPFYLIVFELWRKLFPERQSLSIFCDELDYRIAMYDLEAIDSDEPIQDGLANLLEVLEENTDAGADPVEILGAISEYCAHDLESFIYDYIAELLDGENFLYASELIEGFSPYVLDPLWFDFLRARSLSFNDIGDANRAMHKIFENELELDLLMEMIRFLSANGEHDLFKLAVKKALPLLTSQEEVMEIMRQIADYYGRLDEETKEEEVLKMLSQSKTGPIHSQDLKLLHELIAE